MRTNVLPDESTGFGRRVRERLRDGPVIWLTTVGADGTPQPNPVGFLWDGADSVLTDNRTEARHLPATGNPQWPAKYAEAAKQVFGGVERFAREYPVAMRVRLTKVRGY